MLPCMVAGHQNAQASEEVEIWAEVSAMTVLHHGSKGGKRRHREGSSVLPDQVGGLFAEKQGSWFL